MTDKAKTLKELAAEYGVHPNTMSRYLKRCKYVKPSGAIRFFFPADLQIIYEKLGRP